MAMNRPGTLDPALMRPGRLDRKVEFSLPDLDGRTNIFKMHARSMSVEKGIRYELLTRVCPHSTGAKIRSVHRDRHVHHQGQEKGKQNGLLKNRNINLYVGCYEKDFLDAVHKLIKSLAKLEFCSARVESWTGRGSLPQEGLRKRTQAVRSS